MDAISNLVFNSLAKHEAVRLSGVGSLEVTYRPASIDEQGQLVPPSNAVVYSRDEPENVVSVTELIEHSVGAGKENAEELYTNWIAGMRSEEVLVIEKAGEIRHDAFHIYPELNAILNPAAGNYAANPVKVKKTTNRNTVILWVAVAVLLGIAIAIGIISLMERSGGRNIWGHKPQTHIEAPGTPSGTAAGTAPSTASPEAPAGQGDSNPPVVQAQTAPEPGFAKGTKVYHVVAGVFSIDSNADKFIAQARAKGSTAQFTKIPWAGKTLVSAFGSANREEADKMRRQLSSHLDELWITQITAK